MIDLNKCLRPYWRLLLYMFVWYVILLGLIYVAYGKTPIEDFPAKQAPQGILLDKKFEGVYRDYKAKTRLVIENVDILRVTAFYFTDSSCYLREEIGDNNYTAVCYQSARYNKPIRAVISISEEALDTLHVGFWRDEDPVINFTFKKERPVS